MATVVLFHHALGLTPGVEAFAERLRSGGHDVTVPDLFAGRTFTSMKEGLAHAAEVGHDEIAGRAERAVEGMPGDIVYAGMCLGAVAAQRLAQSRDGAVAAVLLHRASPQAEFPRPWQPGVRLQLHVARYDPWARVDAAMALAEEVEDAELHLYPGPPHLFTDATSADHEPVAAMLAGRRTLEFLRALG